MSSSKWIYVLPPCGVLVTALVCLPLAAADVSDSDVDLTIEQGGREFTNSVGMKLVRISKGKFMMGTPDKEHPNAQVSERPRHEVELTNDFFMGAHEVTQKQYRTVMGSNPSYFSKTGGGAGQVNNQDTDDFPVDNVSWDDAQEFLEKLNALAAEKSRGRVYRLPTEAEWEYSCRAGSDVKEPFTLNKPTATLDPKQANVSSSKLQRTCRVGSYEANPFGLYDMHGNQQEWCHDWYAETTYRDKKRKDPMGPKKGRYRVLRGGGWASHSYTSRSGSRYYASANGRVIDFGFRVACDVRRD